MLVPKMLVLVMLLNSSLEAALMIRTARLHAVPISAVLVSVLRTSLLPPTPLIPHLTSLPLHSIEPS